MILPESGLSDNEIAVLVCAARGYNRTIEIAEVLSGNGTKITTNAINKRSEGIYDKFEEHDVARNFQAAVEYFISQKWDKHPKVIKNFGHIPTKTY